MTEKSSTVTF